MWKQIQLPDQIMIKSLVRVEIGAPEESPGISKMRVEGINFVMYLRATKFQENTISLLKVMTFFIWGRMLCFPRPYRITVVWLKNTHCKELNDPSFFSRAIWWKVKTFLYIKLSLSRTNFSVPCQFETERVYCRYNYFLVFTKQNLPIRKIGHVSEVSRVQAHPIAIERAICPDLNI